MVTTPSPTKPSIVLAAGAGDIERGVSATSIGVGRVVVVVVVGTIGVVVVLEVVVAGAIEVDASTGGTGSAASPEVQEVASSPSNTNQRNRTITSD
jgi:hypothetical protein